MPHDYEIKNRIVNGVDRPIEELTVDAICHNSGVSRPTFYRHFGSKYDLGYWYASCVEEYYLDEIGRSYSWEEGLTGHYELLYEKRDLFFYTSAHSQEEKLLSGNMQQHRVDVVTQKLAERGIEVDDDMAYFVETYAMIETTMSGRWMRNHMDRPPARMASLVARCVPRELYDALQL
jgi:AcrR family transcriptional regulator